MQTIKVKWTGIRPLILSNPQTVQLSNKHAVESRRINALLKAARKKQDEHKLAELEQQQILNDWKASAYYDDKVNKFFVPDTLILACIKNGAMAGRKGKDIDRAVLITETAVHIETPTKHNSIQGYFNDPAFRLECPCKVPPKTGALIWKARCMIPTGWSIQFQIEYNENIIADKSLTEALELAGANCGLGGWRPKFGRFLWEEI